MRIQNVFRVLGFVYIGLGFVAMGMAGFRSQTSNQQGIDLSFIAGLCCLTWLAAIGLTTIALSYDSKYRMQKSPKQKNH